jgi:signal transduction histidine kinase
MQAPADAQNVRRADPAAPAAPALALPSDATPGEGGNGVKAAASRWPRRLYALALVAGYTQMFVALGVQLDRVGGPLPFFEQVLQPGVVSVFFCFFFGAAAVLSLAAHALLSYYPDVQRIAAMSTAFTAYVIVQLALDGMALQYHQVVLVSIHDAAVLAMFFAILAETARGGIGWAAAQLLLFTAVAIVLGQTDPVFQSGNRIELALAAATNWEISLFYVYVIVGGLLRWGALRACQHARAARPRERWGYRLLIVAHVALYYSNFALRTVLNASGLDSAVLLLLMIITVLYAFTPLMLVHLLTLSHSHAMGMAAALEAAARGRAAAEAASSARKAFLRYVFHEVRVPFNSIVLGLEELGAYPPVASCAGAMSDIAMMAAAANSMQQILNDTLEVEKMSSGTYAMERRPISLADTMRRVVHAMRPWARQARVALAAELHPGLPRTVLADGNRLAQVAANFVSNAIKFSPQDGSGTVVLRMFPIAGLPPGATPASQSGSPTSTPALGAAAAATAPGGTYTAPRTAPLVAAGPPPPYAGLAARWRRASAAADAWVDAASDWVAAVCDAAAAPMKRWAARAVSGASAAAGSCLHPHGGRRAWRHQPAAVAPGHHGTQLAAGAVPASPRQPSSEPSEGGGALPQPLAISSATFATVDRDRRRSSASGGSVRTWAAAPPLTDLGLPAWALWRRQLPSRWALAHLCSGCG